jgi:hypothetical protein
MNLEVRPRGAPSKTLTCARCGNSYSENEFFKSPSSFFNGRVPVCRHCLVDFLKQHDYDWDSMNKICQLADVPFIPELYTKIIKNKMERNETIQCYFDTIFSDPYDKTNWSDYYKEYKDLEDSGLLRSGLPLISDKIRAELIEKWGKYDDEGLSYLENLYNGLVKTQNIAGALQNDQALKICKISYELDRRIQDGEDFDKILSSYDKLVKTAEFTPKNTKNATDFDSIGELLKWLEKRGWKAKYYDNETRDIVDETMKNIQNYSRRLYTNETGIGDEISRRIEALKTAKNLETMYGIEEASPDILDKEESDSYGELLSKEDFNPEGDDDG